MHDYTAAKRILEKHGLSHNQPDNYWAYSCNGNNWIPVTHGIRFHPVLFTCMGSRSDANAKLINAVNDELAALKLKPESNGSEQN